MKKLFLLLVPAAMLFACNTELSAEQYRAQSEKQCMNQISKQLLGDDATEAEKEQFCDCYFDYMLGDAETVKMGEMMKKATKAKELAAVLEDCADDVTKAETVIETPENEMPVAPAEVNTDEEKPAH